MKPDLIPEELLYLHHATIVQSEAAIIVWLELKLIIFEDVRFVFVNADFRSANVT